MNGLVQIRPWKPEDAAELAAICNNKKIWLNVRDKFPYPYTLVNALEWIAFSLNQNPERNLAIIYDGNISGSIGVMIKDDVYRRNIEIGYFIGEAYWNKGIATTAVALLVEYIKSHFDVSRIYAEVFGHNAASMRVLEKNGFHLEGVREKAVKKNDIVLDDYVWVPFV